MQSAGEYLLKPPLTNSACIRARFAARICDSLMVWAETAEAKISQADEIASRNGRMKPFANKNKPAA
jgi:alkanesulfonate monooxygenase SsuD/methylene tetrahydromethanopterin reductase-like flavin-dependent oxidoreductase (luciferase family)